LQYYYTPNITVTIPNSLVLSCVYFGSIMRISVSINNSLSPNNNTINLVIATSTVTF
jgi:hypothetical protein